MIWLFFLTAQMSSYKFLLFVYVVAAHFCVTVHYGCLSIEYHLCCRLLENVRESVWFCHECKSGFCSIIQIGTSMRADNPWLDEAGNCKEKNDGLPTTARDTKATK